MNDAAQAVPDDSDVALCCDSDEHELEWLAAMHQLSACSVRVGVAQCTRWGARKPFINAGWVALVGMVATLFSELSQLGVFVAFVAEHVRELAQRQPDRRTDMPLHHLCSMMRCAASWSVPGIHDADRARASASATLVLRRLASEVWIRIAVAVAASLPHGPTRTIELRSILGWRAAARFEAYRHKATRGAGGAALPVRRWLAGDEHRSLGPRTQPAVACPFHARSAKYAGRAGFVIENPHKYLDVMSFIADWAHLAYTTSLCYWGKGIKKVARLWTSLFVAVLENPGETTCPATDHLCRFTGETHQFAMGGGADRAVPRGPEHFERRNSVPPRLIMAFVRAATNGYRAEGRGTPWVLDLYSGSNSVRRAVRAAGDPVRVVSVNIDNIVHRGVPVYSPDLYIDIMARLLTSGAGLASIVDDALAFLNADAAGCTWRSLVLVWVSPPCETYSMLQVANEGQGYTCHREWQRDAASHIVSSPPLRGPPGFVARLHDAALVALLRQLPAVLDRTA